MRTGNETHTSRDNFPNKLPISLPHTSSPAPRTRIHAGSVALSSSLAACEQSLPKRSAHLFPTTPATKLAHWTTTASARHRRCNTRPCDCNEDRCRAAPVRMRGSASMHVQRRLGHDCLLLVARLGLLGLRLGHTLWRGEEREGRRGKQRSERGEGERGSGRKQLGSGACIPMLPVAVFAWLQVMAFALRKGWRFRCNGAAGYPSPPVLPIGCGLPFSSPLDLLTRPPPPSHQTTKADKAKLLPQTTNRGTQPGFELQGFGSRRYETKCALVRVLVCMHVRCVCFDTSSRR